MLLHCSGDTNSHTRTVWPVFALPLVSRIVTTACDMERWMLGSVAPRITKNVSERSSVGSYMIGISTVMALLLTLEVKVRSFDTGE